MKRHEEAVQTLRCPQGRVMRHLPRHGQPWTVQGTRVRWAISPTKDVIRVYTDRRKPTVGRGGNLLKVYTRSGSPTFPLSAEAVNLLLLHALSGTTNRTLHVKEETADTFTVGLEFNLGTPSNAAYRHIGATDTERFAYGDLRRLTMILQHLADEEQKSLDDPTGAHQIFTQLFGKE